MVRLSMCKILSFLLLLSFVQFSVGQKKYDVVPADDRVVVHQRAPLFALSKISNQAFVDKVSHTDVYTLHDNTLEAINVDQPEKLFLTIPIGKSTTHLLLRKINITSSNYRLITSSGVDRSLRLDVQTYRGVVDGTDRRAVLTISNQKVHIVITTDKGNYEINPSGSPDIYFGHYAKSRTQTKDWNCETEDQQRPNSPIMAGTRTGDCIEVYLECDFRTFQDNGSNLSATETWVINMMNSVISLYDDINVPLVVSEIFIWDTTDPYIGATTLTNLRNTFMDEIQDTYNGRIAMLVSTKSVGGGLSNGIGGLCGSYGDFPSPYAITTNLEAKYDDFPMFSYNIYVLAHELGHVIGARHTHACVWNGNNTQIDDCGNIYANNNGGTPEGITCFDPDFPVLPTNGGTIMSNCNLVTSTGVNFMNGFHPLVAAELQSSFSQADCATGIICAEVAPSNDICSGAIELTAYDVCNASIYDNYLATISGTLPSFDCGVAGMSIDVWFKVLIPASGNITIETTDDGTLDDVTIQTYIGDCNNLVRSMCDDNSGVANHALAIHSGLTAGEYLYIRLIDAGNDEEGTFGLCAYDVSLPCHPDYDALISIYNDANGPSWTNNTGWVAGAAGTDCDVCQWYGVVCDGFGRVKELNVSNNNLTGSLSNAIADLASLEKINLFNHGMSGTIPDVMNMISDLRYIDLSNGTFSGPIPDFAGLDELEIIYLENNSLTGLLPSAIADLLSINIFWVKNNMLSGCIPANYTPLCNIQSVQMQNNEDLPSDGDFTQFCEFGLGLDNDNDGFCSGIDTDDDCNDDESTAYPGATEVCDGLDNNCNVSIDEGFVFTNTWIGGNSDWNVDANWSLAHVPDICEDVVITNGNVNIGTNDAVARSVTITNSGYLGVSGSLMIKGSDGSSFIAEVGSSSDISGSMEIFSLNGNAVSISGSIINTGSVSISHPKGLIHIELIGNGLWTNVGLGVVSLLVVN